MVSVSNNYDYRVNININGGNTFAPSAPTGSSSAALPIVDKTKKDLLEKLGIDEQTYVKILSENPDFSNLKLEEQLEIAEKYKTPEVVSESVEDVTVEKVEQPKNSFDRKTYNSLTKVSDKIDTCFYEVTKNIYIHGFKDNQGHFNLPAHSEEEWNNLSEEAKQAEVTKIKTFINNNEKLGLKDKFLNLEEDKQGKIVDQTMMAIQAANNENISIAEFLFEKTVAERIDAMCSYISNLPEDEQTDYEKDYLTKIDRLTELTQAAVNEKNKEMGLPEMVGSLEGDFSTVSELLRYYNLNQDEVIYNALKNKNNRTESEQKVFDSLEQLYSDEAGQAIIKRQKIANLQSLQNEFLALEQKAQTEELMGEDLQKYEILKRILNTQESKDLLKLVDFLPKPQTSYEKTVADEIADLNKANLEEFVDNDMRLLNSVRFIERKTKGMSLEEKERYITTFLKFNTSSENVGLFRKYAKDFKSLWGKDDLLLESGKNIDVADDNEFCAQSQARVSASNGKNPILRDNAIASTMTINSILASDKCSGKECDNRKALNAEVNANRMHYETEAEATSVLNSTTDVNTTITDAKIQLEAQEKITNSEAANDDVHIYTVSKTKDFHKDNQVSVLDGATAKSAKATAYAAENNVIAQLDSSNQKDAYSLVQSRINEQYKGADVDKYSSALAGQIKNCDAKVQSELVDMVYQSGNQKAIETATANMTSYKSEAVMQQEYPRLFGEAVLQAAKGAEFQEKFLNGSLSLQEISQLTPTERREYFEELFKKASPEQKIKWLSKMSNGTQKKTVYTFIALYDQNLLGRMVESGLGLEMFNVCNDIKAQNKIFAVMDRSENETVKQQCALIKNDPRNAGLFIGKTSDTDPKTANTLNNYASVPFLHDGFDLFKRQDKLGRSYLNA